MNPSTSPKNSVIMRAYKDYLGVLDIKDGICAHRYINKEIEYIKILQQKFGSHVVGAVKDKHWKVVLKKL